MTREEAVSIIEDRVRLTEYVEDSYVDCVDIEALKMAIEALRQPEPRWIPVTERMPEERKEVLATTVEGWMYIARHDSYDGKAYWEETTEYCNINVTAWMPLPEPWKGE